MASTLRALHLAAGERLSLENLLALEGRFQIRLPGRLLERPLLGRIVFGHIILRSTLHYVSFVR
jgi:hypothetical protein